ncbi:serine/threonine-protein kinase [Actinomadura madurae]|uniref:serine/threonine-protein kinase n=1 Tax=Actinomadura madurae TaxID=1993 RepID=UPI0020D2580D|nr:serine/threonine-protein kinase [Actinomadura madurae]MCP9947845.1 serine/threonine protein kinase [Actinomadura madurae]MCP9977087.1 serine/threonine protein kinase [Actinomadura madurae]MCQ0011401.1 serine/threonine protein kinase [Actinomadura madurae]
MPEPRPLNAHDPRRLGGYALLGRLGSGAQGTVYLGEGADGQRVAVKLLRVQFEEDDTARARFVREAEVAKQVARFCTAQFLDAEVAGDSPYLVSEYVPGEALNRLVARDGPMRGGALDRLAVSTASALTAIHRAGIVHRDLKPHNVLLGPDGPRVIDFGLSRVLDAASAVSSRAVGTPAYMAPEQVSGGEIGATADVFAWGATMVFAATGRPPFGSDSVPAVMYRVLHHEPDLGGLDGELRELVAAALDKDPARRPTAAQLLLRLVGHEEAFESPPAGPGPTGPPPAPPEPSADGPADGAAEGTPEGTGGAGDGDTTLPPAATAPNPDGGRPGGRRRLGRALAAAVAAAVVAAAAGAAGYVLLDRRGGEPSGTTGAGGGRVTAPTTAGGRSSAPPSSPSRSRTSRPPGTTAPGRPGQGRGRGPAEAGAAVRRAPTTRRRAPSCSAPPTPASTAGPAAATPSSDPATGTASRAAATSASTPRSR